MIDVQHALLSLTPMAKLLNGQGRFVAFMHLPGGCLGDYQLEVKRIVYNDNMLVWLLGQIA